MNDGIAGVEYLSIGANRHTAVADWHKDGSVAFGADSNIALWKPNELQPRGVRKLLTGHQDVVKTVKFLPNLDGEQTAYLISGSDDQHIRLWKLCGDDDGGAVSCLQVVHEHSAPVNCIAVARTPRTSSRTIFATGAADASIKIWLLVDEELKVLQTIKTTPKFFPLALALSTIGENENGLVLAAAGTRDTIQIFVAQHTGDSPPNFQLQATLSGHEGWIRSLDFTREKTSRDTDLLLASASQDKYIRLWRFHQGKELPAAAANGADPSLGAFMPGKSPSNKVHRLKAADTDFTITFEALLLGHDDWIYSAKWFTHATTGKLQLLSTSADNTLAIWESDPSSGIWVSMVRLGEISREKGATTATGSTGGFWTGLWSPAGTSVVCLGRTGSWRRWDYNEDHDQWTQQIGISGHVKSITGISWSKNGKYLLSTSSDQTTRLHAKWKGEGKETWHEMARPQIHGYDLNCIDSIGNFSFVSGADEKLMRVFDEPKAVAKLLARLCDIGDAQIDQMADAANMPVLGLSNKAIDAMDDDQEIEITNPERDREALDPGSTVRKSALEIDHPPFEDSLSRHTLWPETEKLYGHGYEISCLAVSHDGTLVASACKASSLNHAVIRLFETEKWTEVRPPLTAHSLTTTRLRFSADDRYLLSVGRDRQWVVFERVPDATLSFKPSQTNPKGHSRMILDAAWSPSPRDSEPLVFATAGRDKQVKVWARNADGENISKGFQLASTISETHPVTAVDFLLKSPTAYHVLAVGTENGSIAVHHLDCITQKVLQSKVLSDLCLPKAVLQLAWKPINSENGEEQRCRLAAAGDDGSLRILSFPKFGS